MENSQNSIKECFERKVHKLYENAVKDNNEYGIKALHIMFGEDYFKSKGIMERIKTFEDACRELGDEHPLVLAYKKYMNIDSGEEPDVITYLKLRIICAALNEGWEPQFTSDEYRYFPWFHIYTKKKHKNMDEKERNCIIGHTKYANKNCVRILAAEKYASLHIHTTYGSRLALKSEELAIYCGKQFTDIWADLVRTPTISKTRK